MGRACIVHRASLARPGRVLAGRHVLNRKFKFCNVDTRVREDSSDAVGTEDPVLGLDAAHARALANRRA